MTAPIPKLQELQPYELKNGIEEIVRKEKPKFTETQIKDRTNWIYSLTMCSARREAIKALAEYREEQVTPLLLVKEKHCSGRLGKFLNASDKVKPDTIYEAHAIVSGTHRNAEAARVMLATYGIRIDDPDNGVWLPNFRSNVPHDSFLEAPAHRTIHTPQYHINVEALLDNAADENEARAVLKKIGKRLQQGLFPYAKGQRINIRKW